MSSSIKSDRFANHNNPPRPNPVRMDCPADFPPLSALRPVFVAASAATIVEIAAPDGLYRPEMILFATLDGPLLSRLRARAILSCLVTRAFDAIDLAAMLNATGFDGRYLAVTREAPDRALIRREVRSRAPSVDFDVFAVRYTPLGDGS